MCLKSEIISKLTAALRHKTICSPSTAEETLRRAIYFNPPDQNPKNERFMFGAQLSRITTILLGRDDKETRIHFKSLLEEELRDDFTFRLNCGNLLINQENGQNFTRAFAKICRGFGRPAWITPQTVAVEFSSPNIAKPFHVGHLRSTIIGNFIANINHFVGNKTFKINYFGDWGTQIGLLIFGCRKYGPSIDQKPNEHVLDQLLETYVRINGEESARPEGMAMFARLERGDEEMIKYWHFFRSCSYKNHSRLYKAFDITFDFVEWESQQHFAAKCIVDRLTTINKIVENDGSKCVSLPSLVPLIKSDGSTLYLARDLSAFLERKGKLGFDRIHYIVEKAQREHFNNLKDTLEVCLGFDIDYSLHVPFGRYKGMSTRKGHFCVLNDLFDEARRRIADKMRISETTKAQNEERTAAELAVTALIVNELRIPRLQDVDFDWNSVLDFNLGSGIALQYTHARLTSLLKKFPPDYHISEHTMSNLREAESRDLILQLLAYEDVLVNCYESYEGYLLVNYLLRLGRLTNRGLNALRLKGEHDLVVKSRASLFEQCRRTIAHGMTIIGLQPLVDI